MINSDLNNSYSGANLSRYQEYALSFISKVGAVPLDTLLSMLSNVFKMPEGAVKFTINSLHYQRKIHVDSENNVVIYGSKNSQITVEPLQLQTVRFISRYLRDKEEIKSIVYFSNEAYFIHKNRESHVITISPGDYTSVKSKIADYRREYEKLSVIGDYGDEKTSEILNPIYYILCIDKPEFVSQIKKDIAKLNPPFEYHILFIREGKMPNSWDYINYKD